MATNLNEVLKLAKNNGRIYEAAVISDMLRQSKLLQVMPIKDVDGVKITGTRWNTLPATGTRQIGGTWTASEGIVEEVESTLNIYGGEITVDRILTKIAAKEDVLSVQTKMKVRSMMSTFNYDVINGDNSVDPNTMEGIDKLISNQPTRMTLDCAASGSPAYVLNSATTRTAFIDKLHEAMHYVGADDGSGTPVILMNEKSYLGVSQVLRNSGLLNTAKDAYDREWSEFMGAKLIDVGLKYDQSTEIIVNTTNATSSSAGDSTCIYVCRLATEDGLYLAQLKGTSPEPYDPLNGAEGGLAANPGYLRRIEWVIGLHQTGRYACAKIKGVKFASS
jgi:hypothetical protein